MLKELYLLWLRLAAPQDLHYINGADTLPPPLPPEQERAALDALTRGQPQARDLLITDGNELLLMDVLTSDDPQVGEELERSAERAALRGAVGRLSPRERRIMELRFGLNHETEHTQKEVADTLGISQSYISRLEKRIIRRLRRELEAVG